jgi:glutaminyl-tRNA synthetase
LEFDVHRPLYDWFIQALNIFPSHQYEFARLNINYTVMSKRKLLQLVKENLVSGWDDPRMPTISGLRRRGYTPASLRLFAEKIGVSKRDNVIDVSLLEWCIREDLNKTAQRVMAVLNPLKVVITNYPETSTGSATEYLDAVNNPEDLDAGTRKVPFSRELYIERSDFMEVPEKKFFRLAPGAEVRLKGAYAITCTDVVKNDAGEIVEVRATYDPATKSGADATGRKIKGVLHWVSAAHALPIEARLYDTLVLDNPATPGGTVMNPESLVVLNALAEPSLAEATETDRFQFMRQGYFCLDVKEGEVQRNPEGKLVFNRTVGLRSSYRP